MLKWADWLYTPAECLSMKEREEVAQANYYHSLMAQSLSIDFYLRGARSAIDTSLTSLRTEQLMKRKRRFDHSIMGDDA